MELENFWSGMNCLEINRARLRYVLSEKILLIRLTPGDLG